MLRVFSWNRANQVLKRYINKVKHYTPLKRGTIVTDMKKIESEPLNMIGMNIPSIYGGILSDQYWESRAEDKFFRKLLKGCQKINVSGWDTTDYYQTSSADDDDLKYKQRYDDDKIELMGASDAMNFSLFRMSQFGQARSPYAIEFREDLEDGHDVYFAVDGEFLMVRNPKKIEFCVDPHMPRIKLLRFNPDSLPSI